MDRVSLTKDETEWFARNVVKMTQLLEVSATKDPKVLERSTYKTLASLVPTVMKVKALVASGDEKVDFQCNRKQKLIIKDLIRSVVNTLKDRVIPEYVRRGDSHKDYLDNARKKCEALEKMMRKFK